LPLGHEANQRVDDKDGRDSGGLEAIAEEQGDDGRRDQEEHDDAGQLVAEDDQRGHRCGRRQTIRAEAQEARGRLFLG
jgi:hypothetical protein